MNEADKELLTYAAKSVGIDYGWQHIFDDYEGSTSEKFDWNPLTDDVDAFWLAAKLNLVVGFYGSYSSVCGTYMPDGYEVPDETIVWNSEVNNDPLEAARRAIVRAAAEIGKAMP